MTTDEQIARLVDSQKELTAKLSLLLARDPRQEFGYGQNYTPDQGAPRAFNKVQSFSRVPGNVSTAQVFSSQINNGECEISYGLSSGNLACCLRVEYSDFPDFRDVPSDFSINTVFITPRAQVVNAFNVATGASTVYNHMWREIIPMIKKYIRLAITGGGSNNIVNWSTTQILGVTFRGR